MSARPKSSLPETDWFGRPLVQTLLPSTDGIQARSTVPHVGDRVTVQGRGAGIVLSVGEMAHWGGAVSVDRGAVREWREMVCGYG